MPTRETKGCATMRYGAIRGIIEAGNCVYCGKHIDDGGHIFLCEECRRKEEGKECLHGKLKEEATAMVSCKENEL